MFSPFYSLRKETIDDCNTNSSMVTYDVQEKSTGQFIPPSYPQNIPIDITIIHNRQVHSRILAGTGVSTGTTDTMYEEDLKCMPLFHIHNTLSHKLTAV